MVCLQEEMSVKSGSSDQAELTERVTPSAWLCFECLAIVLLSMPAARCRGALSR